MNKGITVNRISPDGKTFNSDFTRLEELRGGGLQPMIVGKRYDLHKG